MLLSASPVAVCCSRASSRSRVSRATSVSSPGGDDLDIWNIVRPSAALRGLGLLFLSTPSFDRRAASPGAPLHRVSPSAEGHRSHSKAHPGSGLFVCV